MKESRHCVRAWPALLRSARQHAVKLPFERILNVKAQPETRLTAGQKRTSLDSDKYPHARGLALVAYVFS